MERREVTMLDRTEILKMLRLRQPLETARLERQGKMWETVDRMAETFSEYEVNLVTQVLARPDLDGMERVYEVERARRQAEADNRVSLDMMVEWEPEARKLAVESGLEEFESTEAEEDSVLEPYIQEFLPVCGGDRKAARQQALEYAQATGRLALLHI